MIALWGLSYSEAGWITAAFYGAYILAVPFLVTLTDRLDPKLVYLSGVALTVVGHLLFGLVADGFWSAMAARALTGAGWAGTYMTGLKLLADRVDAKLLSRATAGHAASIGISGALSFACADARRRSRWLEGGVLRCVRDRGARMGDHLRRSSANERCSASGPGCAVRLPSGAAQSLRHGVRDRLRNPHARDERVARLGCRFPRFRSGFDRRDRISCFAGNGADHARPRRHGREHPRQRGRHSPRPPPAHRSRAPGFDRLRRPAGPFRLRVLRLGGRVAPSLRTHHLARLVVAAPPAPRSRRVAVQRSPSIPCSATSAASSVRSPSGGFSTSAVEWRPQRGQRLFLPSHCFRSSPWLCSLSCGRKSSPATVGRNEPTSLWRVRQNLNLHLDRHELSACFASHVLPNRDFWEAALRGIGTKLLRSLVGVQGFETWTRSLKSAAAMRSPGWSTRSSAKHAACRTTRHLNRRGPRTCRSEAPLCSNPG